MKDQLEKSEALVIGPTRASSDVTPAIKQGFNMGKFTEELAFSQQEQQTFKFGDCEIRVVVRDGDPWFVASDVASALCYRNASDAARNLKDHQKGTHIVRTLGGSQKVTIITESGLYKLVLRSRKPEAEEFSDWVTGEVLPSIRKTGSYAKAPVDADQIALARRAALLATTHVYKTVFEAVMEGRGWQLNKYMLYFDITAEEGTVPRMQAADKNSYVLPITGFYKAIEKSVIVDPQTLANLASVCTNKLGRMARCAMPMPTKALEVAA